MIEPTEYLTVHPRRRQARRVERQLQEGLDQLGLNGLDARRDPILLKAGEHLIELPSWARGVRVSHAGRRMFQVVATRTRGR